MNPNNIFVVLDIALKALMNAAGDPMLAYAKTLSLSIFAAVFAWYAVLAALDVIFSRGGYGIVRLASYVGKFLIVRTILSYYNAPMPFTNESFHESITNGSAKIAGLIDMNITDQLFAGFKRLLTGMQQPGIGNWFVNIGELIHFWVANFATIAAEIVVVLIIGFGWVALTVCILLGPYFIVMALIPAIASRSLGWFNCFLQYSFYAPVANAFVWVYSYIVINWIRLHPGPYTADYIAGMSVTFLAVAIAMVFAVLKVPAFTADLFRGSAGQHAFPAVGFFRG